ncbi:MAG TPA: type II secretion system major pseudopilin GspG [Hyphomonas sp.]|nr:type II secretion system major pseudopilin GspG [Hyphomonas sp.]
MTADKKNERKRRKDAGFSLVELMVVIFIMGLLATLVIVNVAPVGEQSRVGKARSDIATFESALEMYSLDMYTYPSGDAGLAALKTPPANADVASYRPGGYIKRLRDDPWGNPYNYDVPGQRSGGGYDVYSAGPDGKPGNEDDIGNWQ